MFAASDFGSRDGLEIGLRQSELDCENRLEGEGSGSGWVRTVT